MLVAFKYNGTTHKSTNFERAIRRDRCTKLMELFEQQYTEDEITQAFADGFFFIINGDSDTLEVEKRQLHF